MLTQCGVNWRYITYIFIYSILSHLCADTRNIQWYMYLHILIFLASSTHFIPDDPAFHLNGNISRVSHQKSSSSFIKNALNIEVRTVDNMISDSPFVFACDFVKKKKTGLHRLLKWFRPKHSIWINNLIHKNAMSARCFVYHLCINLYPKYSYSCCHETDNRKTQKIVCIR